MRRRLQFKNVRAEWLTGILLMLLASSLAAAQDGMQFNVPYLCSDGSTYVVHKCEKGPKFEFCYYQRDQNSERYNIRSQVWNQMQTCKVNGQGAGNPAGASAAVPSDLDNSRWDCGAGAMMTIAQCQRQAGQEYCVVTLEQNGQFLVRQPKLKNEIAEHVKACKPVAGLNPPYLTEFPNKDRVIKTMTLHTPKETVIRSIGAFYQLSEIIQTLAQGQGGNLTQDAKKFVEQYNAAIADLEQTSAQNLKGEQLTVANNPYHFSRSDPKFGFEGIQTWLLFLSPPLQAEFARIVGGNNPDYNAKMQQARLQAFKVLQGYVQDAQARAAEQQVAKDPGSVAVRKCVESGRSDLDCLKEGMKIGFVDLTGDNKLVKAALSDGPPGLRLSGVYSAGNFSLAFGQDSVLVGCRPLLPMPIQYSVERNRQQVSVAVSVPTTGKTNMVLAYGMDGKLTGPGMVEIHGEVPVGGGGGGSPMGYEAHTTTTTQQRQIDASEVGQYSADVVHQNGMEYSVDQQVTTTSYEQAPSFHRIPTKPATEKCMVGLLPATGSNVKVSDVLTQALGSQASKAAAMAPGLRLAGSYAVPGGMKMEFRDDSVTLECNDARTAVAYSVNRVNGRFDVRVDNEKSPFTLVLEANGTLVGSGEVEVAGRRIIRSSAGDGVHNFVPINQRCQLGTLAPEK